MAKSRCLTRGLLAGAFAGWLGSLAMTAFQEAVARNYPPQPARDGTENTTEKTARQVTEYFGGTLSPAAKHTAGRALHYGFGTVFDALYGGAAEFLPLITTGAGIPYGTVLTLATDGAALPALSLAKMPADTTRQEHLLHWGAHLAYSTTLELTRRTLRFLF